MKRVQDYLDAQKRVLESELTTASSSTYSSLEKGTISCCSPIAEISGVIDAMRADSPFSFHSEIGSSFADSESRIKRPDISRSFLGFY
ncbi:MAG: hypothetical protein WCI18_15630 [Pseudomonadota bacterium]